MVKNVSLEKWLKDAKKDGLVKDGPSKGSIKMEVKNEGSTPSKKENKTITDAQGYKWLVTPRGFKYPLPSVMTRKEGLYAKLPKNLRRYERFGTEHPCIQEWLNTIRAEGTKGNYARALLRFCVAKDISPKEFGDLHTTIDGQREAKTMATKYILPLVTSNPFESLRATKALRSFFWAYSGGFPLPLDLRKLKPREEDKTPFEKTKFYYGPRDEMREHMKRMIDIGSRDLRDTVALTLLFRAGLRGNTLNHFKVKNVQDIIKLEHPEKEGVTVELLCLTIIGYNKKTGEGICEKTAHYPFPPLIDSPGQPKGYYTFLGGSALELFRNFMVTYHKNSAPNDHLFVQKKGGSFQKSLRNRFKQRIVNSGVYPERGTNKDPTLIRLHDFRWIFGELASENLSQQRAEMLAGHKLKGVMEHYRKRTKKVCGQDYLKIKFEITTDYLKEKWLKELAEQKEQEEEKFKETIIEEPLEQPETMPKVPTMPSELNAFVLHSAPKKCLRELDFTHAKDNSYCKVCMQTHQAEYEACQELRKERPDLFI